MAKRGKKVPSYEEKIGEKSLGVPSPSGFSLGQITTAVQSKGTGFHKEINKRLLEHAEKRKKQNDNLWAAKTSQNMLFETLEGWDEWRAEYLNTPGNEDGKDLTVAALTRYRELTEENAKKAPSPEAAHAFNLHSNNALSQIYNIGIRDEARTRKTWIKGERESTYAAVSRNLIDLDEKGATFDELDSVIKGVPIIYSDETLSDSEKEMEAKEIKGLILNSFLNETIERRDKPRLRELEKNLSRWDKLNLLTGPQMSKLRIKLDNQLDKVDQRIQNLAKVEMEQAELRFFEYGIVPSISSLLNISQLSPEKQIEFQKRFKIQDMAKKGVLKIFESPKLERLGELQKIKEKLLSKSTTPEEFQTLQMISVLFTKWESVKREEPGRWAKITGDSVYEKSIARLDDPSISQEERGVSQQNIIAGYEEGNILPKKVRDDASFRLDEYNAANDKNGVENLLKGIHIKYGDEIANIFIKNNLADKYLDGDARLWWVLNEWDGRRFDVDVWDKLQDLSKDKLDAVHVRNPKDKIASAGSAMIEGELKGSMPTNVEIKMTDAANLFITNILSQNTSMPLTKATEIAREIMFGRYVRFQYNGEIIHLDRDKLDLEPNDAEAAVTRIIEDIAKRIDPEDKNSDFELVGPGGEVLPGDIESLDERIVLRANDQGSLTARYKSPPFGEREPNPVMIRNKNTGKIFFIILDEEDLTKAHAGIMAAEGRDIPWVFDWTDESIFKGQFKPEGSEFWMKEFGYSTSPGAGASKVTFWDYNQAGGASSAIEIEKNREAMLEEKLFNRPNFFPKGIDPEKKQDYRNYVKSTYDIKSKMLDIMAKKGGLYELIISDPNVHEILRKERGGLYVASKETILGTSTIGSIKEIIMSENPEEHGITDPKILDDIEQFKELNKRLASIFRELAGFGIKDVLEVQEENK